MPFIEYADVVPSMISEQQMIELTDDKQLNVVDMNIFTDIRDDVQALIEGFTRIRYPDGFATTPRILVKLAKDITLYECRKRRPHIVSEQMEKDQAARIKLLVSIGNGTLSLGAEQAAEEAAAISGSFKTNKTSEDRMFPKSELDKY